MVQRAARDSISHQELSWSPLGLTPESSGMNLQFPLEEMAPFPDARGRSGDILIVQFRSETSQNVKRRAALQSLGLKGLRSSVVRSSADPDVLGNIEKVRDLVGVVVLDGVIYKASQLKTREQHVNYEQIEFGTNTRPGGLVRSSDGDYLHFESSRRHLLMQWSTTVSPVECIDLLLDTLPDLRWAAAEDSALVGLPSALPRAGGSEDEIGVSDEEGFVEYDLPSGVDIIDLPAPEAIDIVKLNTETLVTMNLGSRALDLLWHRPYARFVDSDQKFAEAGVYLRDLALFPAISTFARRTAAPSFFDRTNVEVQVRERGNLKRLSV
jgi:ribosomal protein L30/L7E